MLFLIVIAIHETAKPKNWEWFTSFDQPAQPADELDETSLENIDFRIKREPTLSGNAFLAMSNETLKLTPEQQKLENLPTSVFKEIDDRTMNILKRERPALDAVLEVLEGADQKDLVAAADSEVGYRIINAESGAENYRGRLIHLDGTLRAFRKRELDGLYEGWMFTKDSGNLPWWVLCSEQPEGISLAERMEKRVSVAGYFFKRAGYETARGPMVAPIVVTKTITLKPDIVPRAPQQTENISYYVAGFLAVIGVAFGGMIWYFIRSDQKFAKSRLAKIADSRLDAAPEVVENLNSLLATDPNKVFPEDGEVESS